MASGSLMRGPIGRGAVVALASISAALAYYTSLFTGDVESFARETLRICGRSWIDVDGSGLQKGGNFGNDYILGGISVSLSGPDGYEAVRTTSETSGNYFFGDLLPGAYELTFPGISGYKFTRSNGSVWQKGPRISVVSADTGSIKFHLPEDSNAFGDDECVLKNMDVGYMPVDHSALPTDRSKFLKEESDVSVDRRVGAAVGDAIEVSIQQSESDRERGVLSISHTNVPGLVTASTDGSISISNTSMPGNYVIRYSIEDDEEILDSIEISLELTGKSLLENQYSICGRAFSDLNGSGLQDAGDIVLNGVIVSLHSLEGELVRGPQETLKGGKYKFLGLSKGDYYVKFSLPEGFKGFVNKSGSEHKKWDSDVDSSGFSSVLSLSGDAILAEDAKNTCTINWLDAGLVRVISK